MDVGQTGRPPKRDIHEGEPPQGGIRGDIVLTLALIGGLSGILLEELEAGEVSIGGSGSLRLHSRDDAPVSGRIKILRFLEPKLIEKSADLANRVAFSRAMAGARTAPRESIAAVKPLAKRPSPMSDSQSLSSFWLLQPAGSSVLSTS